MTLAEARPYVLSLLSKNEWMTTREISETLGCHRDVIRRVCYLLKEEEILISEVVKGAGGVRVWKMVQNEEVKDNQPIKRIRKPGFMPSDSGNWWARAPNRQTFYEWRKT